MVKERTVGNLSTSTTLEEEALQVERNKLQSVIDALEDGLTIQDKDYNIIYQNEISIGYFGHHLGEKCYRVYGSGEKVCDGCPVEKSFRDGKSHTSERRGVTPSGEIAFWENTANPIRDARGRIVSCLEITRNITERKRVEEEMWASGEKYRHLFENLNDAVFLADAETGQILETNRQGEALLGMSRNEIVGMQQSALYPPDKAEEYKQRFTAHVAKGRAADYEGEVIRKDGIIVPVYIGALPLTINGHRLILGLFHDATPRKRAEKALRESQEALWKMFESVTDGISVIDLNGVITEVNQRTVEMHGFSSKDELLGKNAFELVAPRDHKRIASNMRKALKQGTIRGVEYTLLKADGSEFPGELSTSTLKGASGNVIGHITIARDITEQKQAEEALADEVTRRRILVEQSLDGIVVLDENAKVYEANQRFAEMLGYTLEEVRELHTWDWDTQWSREELLEMGRKVDAAGFHLETYHRRKDGTTIDVEISVNGAVCGGQKLIFCVCRDITERKRAEQALQAEKNKLQSVIGAMEYGLTIQDKEYNIIYQNEPLREIYGDRVGEKCYRVYEGRDKLCDGCPVEKAFKDGKSHTSERRVVMPSGEVAFGETTANPIRDAEGKIVSCLEVVRNITEQKQAQDALKESQKFSSSLLEGSPNPIFVLNPDTSVRYVNPAFEKLTGFTLAEITGRKAPYPWWPQEQRKEMTAAFKNAMVTGGRRSERIFQKKNGERFWVALNSAPVVHKGKLIYFLINWLDTTEHKQADKALREAEEKFKNLVETTSDMIWEADETGTFTFVSSRIKDILGYEVNEVVGKRRTLDFTPKAEARKWLNRFKEINAKKVPFFGFEITHLHKNGNHVVFEISGIPLFDSAGNLKGFVGINKDITERKQAEEKVRSAAEEWRTTFDSITDFISIHDRDNRIVRVNKAFADALKTTPKKLIGKVCHQLVHGTKEPPANCPHRQTLKTGKPATIEMLEPNLGIYVQESTSPIFDGKGEVAGSVHIAKNITERKRMEEQLMLTDRLASIGELASGIAHELNNPLTSVIGFSQLLMEENIPDNLKEDLGTIYSEAQRASSIVKNLLTFARKHAPMRQLSQVNTIIEDVLRLRAYEHKVNNIEVDKRFATNLPEIMVDYLQMQQVFLNIIVNAESAMLEANGRGKLVITTGRTNDVIKVTIADDGPGIARENLRRVFDPFFTTKEVGKGTGLGLSICHGIVTGHGGRIYAESEISKGATFAVELPVDGSPGRKEVQA